MEVSTEELRQIANMLFEHLERNGHSTIKIPHDNYWEVLDAARYNPNAQPCELGVGSLDDDIERLREILQGKTEPLAFGFVWLSPILQAIGKQFVS